MAEEHKCPGCLGSGKVGGSECEKCNGTGEAVDHMHSHRHGDVIHSHPHEHAGKDIHDPNQGVDVPHDHDHDVIHEHEHRHGNIVHSHPHAHEDDENHELHQHQHSHEDHEHEFLGKEQDEEHQG